MAGEVISIEADVSHVQDALSGTAKSLKSIRRQVLGTVARGTANTIKKGIRQTTTRRSGQLLKAYGYKVSRDGNSASVFPRDKVMKASNHLVIAKAVTLSYGAVITNRKGRDFLQVSGDGYYARPKAVRIAPRGFIQAGEKYAENGAYDSELEKVIEKELRKYWG